VLVDGARFERFHINSLGCTTTARLAGIELLIMVRWSEWLHVGMMGNGALVGDGSALDTTLRL
jgi:hypothetical protein